MTNALKNNVFFLKGILTSIITIFWIASFIIIPKQSFAESFSKDEDSKQYEEALSLRKKGNYSEAVDIFQQLSGYKDADKLYIKTFKELLRRSALGDTIKFGSIKDLDLLWFVVDKNKDSVLLLCKNYFENKYDSNSDSSSWEDCDLRKFLNSDFYNMVFNDLQKSCISETLTDKVNLLVINTKAKDRVFCLCQRDIEKYKILEEKILNNQDQFWLRVPFNDHSINNNSYGNVRFAKYYYNKSITNRSQSSSGNVRAAIRVSIK